MKKYNENAPRFEKIKRKKRDYNSEPKKKFKRDKKNSCYNKEQIKAELDNLNKDIEKFINKFDKMDL